MEASSVNIKRGRPQRHFTPHAPPETMFQYVKTHRGRVEKFLGCRAWGKIVDHWRAAGSPKNHWSAGFFTDIREGIGTGEIRAAHKSILAALGRIDDDEQIIKFAKQIAEECMSTRHAVASLKEWRLGKLPAADETALVIVLAKAVDNYANKHAGVTDEVIVSALYGLANRIDE